MNSGPPLLIWARESMPPSERPVLLWNSFGHPEQHVRTISLPTFVEVNAATVRSRLLGFLCTAKDVRRSSKTLEFQLRTPQGLSAWWLSFPSLKQWGKRQSIPVACRLIAVELIVGRDMLPLVTVETDDKILKELILRSLGLEAGSGYRLRRQLVRAFVHPVRAFGSIVRYAVRTRSLKARADRPIPHLAENAFFDYFSGADGARIVENSYVSPYWGEAPFIANNPDWYHIFPRNVVHSEIAETLRSIDRLNTQTNSHHTLFLERLSISDFISVLANFLSQNVVHRRFRKTLLRLSTDESGLRLWNVFEDEWDDSIIGSTAIRHLILLRSTDTMIERLPQYNKIFYLMENQPWELALTHCVRKHNKGELIGVAHSTIRFWDLRYFTDKRENSFVTQGGSRPHPDRILVNGEVGQQLLLDNGFPQTSVLVVEALRYMYLHELRNSGDSAKKHLLLLGDFLDHANEVLVQVFREAIEKLSGELNIKVRSHPICPLSESQLGPLSTRVSTEPLAELLKSASVVVTTAASSSAAESAALGIPTIVILDARSLNYSPFRQSGNVYFVKNAIELAHLLENKSGLRVEPVDTIFCLDPRYPRWRAEFAAVEKV